MKTYNLVVIGGGPGGYVAAIRAAKLGLSVALIEKSELGGTCLNRGCIPSKTLLRHSEVIESIKHAKSWGIETGEVSFSLEKMIKRKDQVIKRLRTGISSLIKAGNIEHYNGFGEVTTNENILVTMSDNNKYELKAEKMILATGSEPFVPQILGIDEVEVYTSDTIFDITEIPNSLLIIGGGIIGLEFASIFLSLNVDVTVVELDDRIVPNEDKEATEVLHKSLKKKGVTILTSAKVKQLSEQNKVKIASIEFNNGETKELTCDDVLVAVGRKPCLSGIEGLGLNMNGPFVAVNDRLQTNIPNIFAVGDVIGGWQLAHVASAEGLVAAANVANENESIDYKVVPRCIYTSPEIASVGLTEDEAREKGFEVKTETHHNMGNGKALAMDEKEGFIKIIAEKTYGEILGVVMVGPHVTEMISEASAFIYLEGTVDEMAKMIHPHPSLAEGFFEAASSWLGKGIHK